MKFSEISPEEWEELKPYLDTCLIPVTGLQGTEQPFEVVYALERLRDVMDWIEVPFKGRIVTYPAVQYEVEDIHSYLNKLCHNVKYIGFKYVILVSADVEIDSKLICESDLIVTPAHFMGQADEAPSVSVMREIQALWMRSSSTKL
ncbi:hypothetical protein J2Z69_000579 [Paenibacillus shirakamiensis]|uniref:DUF2487 family protein n=1 Tax=Paenibacillus shirakamiensis TaxID=1265935 RepID=A0ABS4JD09_9BACL|nr:DUF2487 family protein [Paenibacillus shirakamiensis]MBP1999560.1 hypothetical protein [Paenibacillus shirakamiensis]